MFLNHTGTSTINQNQLLGLVIYQAAFGHERTVISFTQTPNIRLHIECHSRSCRQATIY